MKAILPKRLPAIIPNAFFVCVLLGTFLLTGCASRYVFHVNAMSAETGNYPQDRTFMLKPAKADVSEQDLLFREAARLVSLALQDRGYRPVDNDASADLLITVDYGVGEAETAYRSRSAPVYLREGPRYENVWVHYRDKDGKLRRTLTTVYIPPRLNFVDNYGQQEAYQVYPKSLALTAYRNGEGDLKELPQVWSVEAKIRNPNEDLRIFLPWLTTALQPYIGEDTGKQVEVVIEPESGEVILPD